MVHLRIGFKYVRETLNDGKAWSVFYTRLAAEYRYSNIHRIWIKKPFRYAKMHKWKTEMSGTGRTCTTFS